MLRGAGFFVPLRPTGGGGEREVRDVAEETPPRYCSTCQHELKPEDLSCPKCGTPLILEALVPTPEADRPVPPPPQPDAGAPGEPAQEEQAEQEEQPAQRGWWRRHPILSGGVGIIVVLFVFISVVGSLGGGGGGEESAKGGADQEHNKSTHKKSTSGGTASTDGLIVFRRYLDLTELTRSAIFTMHPDGSHIRQITNPPEGWGDDFPAWSPDGTKVAFNRECRPSNCDGSRILIVDVNTGFTRSVTHCIPDAGWTKENPPPSSAPYCVGDSEPTFSADGKSIAFRRIIGPKDERSRMEGIFIVGLDGSDPHQVTNVQKRGALEYEDFTPAFSPDGKMLVFERLRLEDDEIAVFVQRLDSSGSPEDARQITPWEMYCGDGPEFSPKGNWVLFSCEGEGGSHLY